ncbi:MAG: Hsp20/alpha crystallin family protein, partial [Methermicoccaceae archaeon]
KIQHFGNVRPTRLGAVEKGVREPFTSTIVDEDTGSLKVTVEMPGVSKENISLSATENTLTIEAKAEDGKRKYYKELPELPAIDPNSADAVYNNGILEVTLKLKEEKKKGGKSIHIK